MSDIEKNSSDESTPENGVHEATQSTDTSLKTSAFEALKERLTNNRLVAVFLLLVLIIVETGHFLTATSDIATVMESLGNQDIQRYDDNLINEIIDVLRQVSQFYTGLQYGLIPSDYSSHRAFYAKVQSDLVVIEALANAENDSFFGHSTASVAEGIADIVSRWQQTDQEDKQLSPLMIKIQFDIVRYNVGLLLQLAYTTRLKNR